MSTITKEFTKEQLQQIEAAAKEVLWPVVWSDKKAREHFSEKITPKVVLKLARIALASLEADAVAYVDPFAFHNFSVYRAGETDNKRMGREWMWANPDAGLIPVYTAPPATVSVPDLTALDNLAGEMLNHAMNCERRVAVAYTHCAHRLAEEVRDLRAAMLQGAEPVTTGYKLPANTPCNDAPEHIWLQTAGVWPENGEFSELTWCSDNQHPDDTLYVRADVVAGNSPVIPDAYDIEAFGIFSATEGENGMMMEVDRFHFETDSCPQIGKDKFVPKFAIQAIINRLQKHCDNMEPDALVNAMSASAAPQQEVKP